MTTPTDLDAIRDRLAARRDRSAGTPDHERAKARAVFQRHAPEDVAVLLDEVERLRARIEVDRTVIRNADAEVERLRATVKTVSDLHRPIPVYDECEHDAEHGCEPIELNEYTGCNESQIGWGCEHCCYPNDWATDECPHDGMHEGVTEDRACPTRIALNTGGEG